MCRTKLLVTNKDKMSFMEKIDFILRHFGIPNTEGKGESVRQWLSLKKLDDEDLVMLLEAYEKFILSNVVGRSEQYCDNADRHNRHILNDGFAYCPECGKEI